VAEPRIPHSWVGHEVCVGLLTPTHGDAAASADYLLGRLHAVDDLSILSALSDTFDDEDELVHAFYPWVAILSVRSRHDAAEVVPWTPLHASLRGSRTTGSAQKTSQALPE
jgi:hypothetical protein